MQDMQKYNLKGSNEKQRSGIANVNSRVLSNGAIFTSFHKEVLAGEE